MKTFESELACQTIDIEDRRVNIRKLENWRRRYKEDASVMGFLASSGPYGVSALMESKVLGSLTHVSQSLKPMYSSWVQDPTSQARKVQGIFKRSCKHCMVLVTLIPFHLRRP